MQLAILQPSFIPDLNYIAVLKKADKIIYSKHDRWSRKGRTHRFRIRTADGPLWISLPIKTEDRKKAISQVRIDVHSDPSWLSKTMKTIAQSYRNSIYFDHYEAEFEEIVFKSLEFEFLIDSITYMNSQLWDLLEWQPESSKIVFEDENEEFIQRSETIFWEYRGTSFQQQFMEKAEVPLEKHPIYKQHFGGFEPDCCLLDVLFELGPEWYRVWDEL